MTRIRFPLHVIAPAAIDTNTRVSPVPLCYVIVVSKQVYAENICVRPEAPVVKRGRGEDGCWGGA